MAETTLSSRAMSNFWLKSTQVNALVIHYIHMCFEEALSELPVSYRNSYTHRLSDKVICRVCFATETQQKGQYGHKNVNKA